jgi:hypothetical protein
MVIVISIRLPPPAVPWDADGWPPFLLLDLLQWKCRPIAKGAYQIKIVRNRTDARFCPVFWLLYWLAVSKLKCGPLIVRIESLCNEKYIPKAIVCRREHDGVIKWYSDEECDTSVEVTIRIMESIMKTAFEKAGYKDATLYTIRKTATMWGARCNAATYELLATGRWRQASNNFYSYVKSGLSNAEIYSDDKTKDPIRKIWAYHPNVITAVRDIEFVMSSALVSTTTERDDDDEDSNTDCLPFAEVRSADNSVYPNVDYILHDVQDLVTKFSNDVMTKVSSPHMALELWEVRMKKIGVHVPIDFVGLNEHAAQSLTVRPPLEDVCFYKHVLHNRVIMVYGPKKADMDNNSQWVKVDRIMTLGLGSDADMEDVDIAEEVEVDRMIPLCISDINKCIPSFHSAIQIMHFFVYGDEKVAKPSTWKTHPNWPTFKNATGFNQHYTELCAQFIYAKFWVESSPFMLKKKERVAKGRCLHKEAQATVDKADRVNIVRYAFSLI